MRVSLTARFLSHPAVEFGGARQRAVRPRLGLTRTATTYHRAGARLHATPTVAALRSQTARFRFSTVGGAVRAMNRGQAQPLGPQRARRT